ncbi:MAG: hypothetical protein IJ916_08200 [Paludibacteraceae bacterium]|nr:hypothetical protein [Paludibacteraceae bacterium]MBR2261668.1 hypothetical protein [Paludibacteraceae bacterium]MEE3483482.1 hypothetical protein [Bacteroidales bacterium]
MKKLVASVLFMSACWTLIAQSAMVVTDPTSFAQRLSLATEEMNEQIEQKYKFIQQIQIAQKAYEESKKIQQRVEQVSTYIKTANEVVDIIVLGEDIMNLCKKMREKVKNSDLLTYAEKSQCIIELINCSSNVSNIAKRASAVVQDKTEKNDAAMSDFERQQELRYLKNEMQLTKAELVRIYNNAFTSSMAEERNNALFTFIKF